MADDAGSRRLSHPILRLDIVAADGTRQSTYRVFCRKQERPIAIGTCCGCVYCESIDSGPAPAVNCVVERRESDAAPDPLGIRTPVGAALRRSAAAVTPDTSARDAFDLLVVEDRRTLPVVDADGHVVGLLDEISCHEAARGKDAVGIMGSKLTLGALVPVRRALELMAAAHLREITIVDETGVPIGILRDVDALGWIARANKG